MQKLCNITTLKTTLKTVLSTAALLLLSTNIQAKRKTIETSVEKPLTEKYHIVVANLSNQQLRAGLRKEGDHGVHRYTTLFLDAGQNLDRYIDRKLIYLQVKGHAINRKVKPVDPEKGALFLIERNDTGDDIIVTPFIDDSQGWQDWGNAVRRAKAKLNQ